MHDSVILLLSPGSSEGFAFFCKLELFCYLNLTGATKFKYERKSEKNSGRNSKMTPSCKCLLTGRKQDNRHLHISPNAPYLPPKILHNLCCSFLLGITAVPREIENNAYAKFGGGGANKVRYGRCASGEYTDKKNILVRQYNVQRVHLMLCIVVLRQMIKHRAERESN